MSNIALPDAAGKVDTFTRAEGPDTVHMQAVVPVDPDSGNPLDLATQTTLAALATAVGTLNAAAAAIQAAVEALNAKTTAVNTGAIAGTVALDAPSLAALETISINGTVPVSGPLTDAQIRATALPVAGTVALDAPSLAALETVSIAGTVPISAAALPLPADAASETTLSAVNAKLPALSGGRMPVELPAGGGGLTDSELRASPVPVSGSFSASIVPDDTAALMACLRALVHPVWADSASGRLRVVLDPLGGAQTLGTVTTVTTCSTVTNLTTCATVTTLNQLAGVSAASMIYDQMHAAWAQAVRPRIT